MYNSGAFQLRGNFATIPGGEGLKTQSYAQFVAGRYNQPQGSSPGYAINPDDFLAIFGNGDRPRFQLTSPTAWTLFQHPGHSTVYHTLAPVDTATTSWPTVGSTYTNNTIVAEADVPVGGIHSAPSMSIGVDSVIESSPTSGVYTVFVHTKKPGTENPDTLNHAVITVTIVDNSPDLTHAGTCGYATCSEIGHPLPNEFIIRTYSRFLPRFVHKLERLGFSFFILPAKEC